MRVKRHVSAVVIMSCASLLSAAQDKSGPPKLSVEADGTVQVLAQSVPLSSFLSPEAKAYVAQHLQQMQDPEMTKQDNGVPRFMKPMIERDQQLYALDRKDEQIGGVHVYVYTPKAGLAEKNEDRVLINLHGGGFSGCWPGCAELESMPVSALMKIKVVTVDYREGPEHKFPAASEDVASVYREMLKNYKAKEYRYLRVFCRGHAHSHVFGVVPDAWLAGSGGSWHLLRVSRKL